jgi:hypothetical protein
MLARRAKIGSHEGRFLLVSGECGFARIQGFSLVTPTQNDNRIGLSLHHIVFSNDDTNCTLRRSMANDSA